MAANVQACQTLVNILEKALVLDTSDTEQRLGCLRRQEKLQKDKCSRQKLLGFGRFFLQYDDSMSYIVYVVYDMTSAITTYITSIGNIIKNN
jgi:hypothetical protein